MADDEKQEVETVRESTTTERVEQTAPAEAGDVREQSAEQAETARQSF